MNMNGVSTVLRYKASPRLIKFSRRLNTTLRHFHAFQIFNSFNDTYSPLKMFGLILLDQALNLCTNTTK